MIFLKTLEHKAMTGLKSENNYSIMLTKRESETLFVYVMNEDLFSPPIYLLTELLSLWFHPSWIIHEQKIEIPLKLDEFRLEIQRRDQEIMSMAAKMKTLEEQHQVIYDPERPPCPSQLGGLDCQFI